MIFPVKIIDAKGKVKDGECLTKDQALENFWINKHKSNKKGNTPMYYLSVAERLVWHRMAKEERIVIHKEVVHRKRKPLEKIYKITCQRCGKQVMRAIARAKWCSNACYRAVNIDNAKKNKNNQIRRLRERLSEVL